MEGENEGDREGQSEGIDVGINVGLIEGIGVNKGGQFSQQTSFRDSSGFATVHVPSTIANSNCV